MADDSSTAIPIESRLELTPGARRRRRFVRWSIWLVVAAAIAAGAAGAARSLRVPVPVRYQTEPVQRGPLTVTVTATGDVQSLTEVNVGTEISGIIETVIGVSLALAVSSLGARALGLPLVLDLKIILIALLFSAGVGVVFGYFPARRAASLNPIDALRHE